MDDPELQEIFTDEGHQEVVDLLKASRPATPPLDPHFRSYLRAKLMTEARRTLSPQAARPWFPFNLTLRTLAPAMAAVAAGFIVVLGVEVYLHNQTTASLVAVNTRKIDHKTDVATTEPIQIQFSGPVDKNAIEESVQIEPATAVTKQWVGNTLVIVPDHPLAPNTTYTVRLKPLATVPTPNPANPNSTPKPVAAATPVVVHFTTIRAPVPRAVPPSFKSSSVNWGHDSRLADSGTILNASWTPAGQYLLVTRPAGQPGPGASATASASGSPNANATTDIWLMSALGTPLRDLVQGATLPAAAPTGGLFASWSLTASNQASLQIRDLQGNLVSTLATVEGVPDRPPAWLGSDQIAYVDKGTLRIIGLHAPVNAPALQLDHGGLAGSADGQLLAVQSTDGSRVLEVTTGTTRTRLPDGATGFAWSSKGDLAFLVQRDTSTDLYVLTDRTYTRVAAGPSGQTWSDLNWAPDAASVLLASKPAGLGVATPSLVLINRDGTNSTVFGSSLREYSVPQWSPAGDLVLFARRDEATGGTAFWTATATASASDAAEKDAIAEVDKFMSARMHGDISTAQSELDDAARAAYDSGASSLVSASGTRFNRYYPVTVQQLGSNPNRFLVGIRIFITKSGVETSFFEEQLVLVLQDQRYVIDAVTSSPITRLGHGPAVISYEVVQNPAGEEVRVHFDADLDAQTITGDTIKIRDADGILANARVTFNPDNHLVTLAVKLRPGTYQLVVTTGITDINGAALAQQYDATLVIGRQG